MDTGHFRRRSLHFFMTAILAATGIYCGTDAASPADATGNKAVDVACVGQEKIQVDDTAAIPIFIISYNRPAWLQRTITAIDGAITRSHEIIIHDNGSNYPPMLAYLDELEQRGITVVRAAPITEDWQLNNVGDSVAAWYQNHDAPYYAITDPDIELEVHDGAFLDVYIDVLNHHPEVTVVGPYYRIDDLPDHYPFKAQIIANETQRDIDVPPFYEQAFGRTVKLTRERIDTQFGLYRKSFKFNRVNDGIQVYSPYASRHLDWYLDPNHLTPEQENYMKKANKITHSGGVWLRESIEENQRKL